MKAALWAAWLWVWAHCKDWCRPALPLNEEDLHPVNLCACPCGPDAMPERHQLGCEWAAVMCRPCAGSGKCSACDGDGAAAAKPAPYRVYVATGLDRMEHAKGMILQLQLLGFEISYDWTRHGSLQAQRDRWASTAQLETSGVESSDALVVLLPGGYGTHTELGIALGARRRVLIVGTDPDDDVRACIFHSHPAAIRCATATDAVMQLLRWKSAKDEVPVSALIAGTALANHRLICPLRNDADVAWVMSRMHPADPIPGPRPGPPLGSPGCTCEQPSQVTGRLSSEGN